GINVHPADRVDGAAVLMSVIRGGCAPRRRRNLGSPGFRILQVGVGWRHGCPRAVRCSGLATPTPQGYIPAMRQNIKIACLKRLNRIEGQARGLARMVADDLYGID